MRGVGGPLLCYIYPVLMKVLYGLLLLSVSAILATGVAMWWRLRRHLRRRPNAARNDALTAARTEHESAE